MAAHLLKQAAAIAEADLVDWGPVAEPIGEPVAHTSGRPLRGRVRRVLPLPLGALPLHGGHGRGTGDRRRRRRLLPGRLVRHLRGQRDGAEDLYDSVSFHQLLLVTIITAF